MGGAAGKQQKIKTVYVKSREDASEEELPRLEDQMDEGKDGDDAVGVKTQLKPHDEDFAQTVAAARAMPFVPPERQAAQPVGHSPAAPHRSPPAAADARRAACVCGMIPAAGANFCSGCGASLASAVPPMVVNKAAEAKTLGAGKAAETQASGPVSSAAPHAAAAEDSDSDGSGMFVVDLDQLTPRSDRAGDDVKQPTPSPVVTLPKKAFAEVLRDGGARRAEERARWLEALGADASAEKSVEKSEPSVVIAETRPAGFCGVKKALDFNDTRVLPTLQEPNIMDQLRRCNDRMRRDEVEHQPSVATHVC